MRAITYRVLLAAILVLPALLPGMTALTGCQGQPKPAPGIINDVALEPEADTGYRVVAIDGEPPRRATSERHPEKLSVAPVALIAPGSHVITVEHRDDNSRRVTFRATTQSNVAYHIELAADGGPQLVAQSDH